MDKEYDEMSDEEREMTISYDLRKMNNRNNPIKDNDTTFLFSNSPHSPVGRKKTKIDDTEHSLDMKKAREKNALNNRAPSNVRLGSSRRLFPPTS